MQYENFSALEILQRGRKKLKKDLDIVQLVNVINNFNIIMRVLFDKDKRLLLQFQESKVIFSHSSSDSLSESQDPDNLAFKDFIE